MQQVQDPRILVVSPVRNEADHIARVARAVAAQELAPARWVAIDDGSSDGTLELLRELEREIDFLTVLQAPQYSPEDAAENPRDRLAHAIEVRNFNLALGQVTAAGESTTGGQPRGGQPRGSQPRGGPSGGGGPRGGQPRSKWARRATRT